MPSEQVTPRDLSVVLKNLGFRETNKRGTHVLYTHARKGAVVSLPTSRPFVPLVVLRAIRRSLDNYGIASPREFESLLGVRIDYDAARSGDL
jgi:predicted RNA binding protein YcfA (HicA-like mRNA interferase family)